MPRARKSQSVLEWRKMPPRPGPYQKTPRQGRRQTVRRPCTSCKRQQPLDFLIRGLGEGSRSHFCQSCWGETVTLYAPRQANGETLDRYYQRTYGIGLDEYGERYLRQQGKCAICCKRPTVAEPLAVDHDHETGAVRGLLCRSCNVGLGCFTDNVAHMGRAIAYLMESA
jgi:hypothetical protein